MTEAERTDRGLSRMETAARLGVSLPTLRRLVKDGELAPPRAISPGRAVHLESEVIAFLRSRPAEPLRERTRAALEARREQAARG